MQDRKLSKEAPDWILFSADNVILNAFAYGTGFLFKISAVIAIGSFSAFMCATVAGSLALYLPLKLISTEMKKRGMLTPLSQCILDMVCKSGSPIVGAVLLNWLFAWTLPLIPVAICACMSGSVYLMLHAYYASPKNTQNDEKPAPQAETKYNPPPFTQAQQAMLFRTFIHSQRRSAFSADQESTKDISRPAIHDRGVLIEQLDDEDNVISATRYD